MARAAQKEAVAYKVRRPFLFDGTQKLAGSIMRPDEFARGKAEVMVRAGRIDPIYELPKGKITKTKTLPGETQE